LAEPLPIKLLARHVSPELTFESELRIAQGDPQL